MRQVMTAIAVPILAAGLLATGPAASAEEDPTPDRIAELRTQGGREAAIELGEILEEGVSAELRVAALEGLAHLGLRLEATRRAVRHATEADDLAVRVAAWRALGRLGDARDVPGLLEGLRSEEGKIRGAAFTALGTLSGRRLPASPTRCAQWWKATEPRTREALSGALDVLPDALQDPAHAASHRATIAREGWVDPGAVADAAKAWLTSPDHALRAEAFHAIAVLRLGALSEATATARRFADETDEEQAAFAAHALGLREGESSP